MSKKKRKLFITFSLLFVLVASSFFVIYFIVTDKGTTPISSVDGVFESNPK